MMSLKRKLLLLPAGLMLLGSMPSLAQMQDPGMEPGVPGEPIPAEPAPVDSAPIDSDPSVEPEITPDASSDPSDSFGGAEPSGPLSLVQCGPGGAASIVTEVPVGCHVLSVNSPPGQAENAETP